MQQIFDIVTSGGILIVVAVGLLLILGIMGVVNLAHGAFMTVGAYVSYIITVAGWSPWLAFVAGPLVGFCFGIVIEHVLIRRLYNRPLDTILATWGLAILTTQIIAAVFGRSAQFIDPPLDGDPIEWAGAFASQYRVFALCVAAGIVSALYVISRTTNIGLIARAVIMNPTLASGLGINTSLVNTLCFGIGSAFAALAGTVMAPLASVDPNLGTPWSITAFMVTLLGGISLGGMVVSAFILAAGQILATWYIAPVVGNALVVLIPIIAMRFLPDGLSSINMEIVFKRLSMFLRKD